MLAHTANAASRKAFVVGINDYQQMPKLSTAVGDATAIDNTLKELGFTVTRAIDHQVDRLAFFDAWGRFLSTIDEGDTVLVFFSGHGLQIGGRNYLLPRDQPAATHGEEVVRAWSIGFDVDIVDRVETRKPGVSIYILDACRDNPFRGLGGKKGTSAPFGLAPIDDSLLKRPNSKPQSGAFVMYSAGANEQALDALSEQDKDPNSVYTRRLLPLLKQCNLTLTRIAKAVQVQVADDAWERHVESGKRVRHKQHPAYYDGILGEFILVTHCSSSPLRVPRPEIAVRPPKPACETRIVRTGSTERCVDIGETFKDCDDCPDMVVVPAGKFIMGTPEREAGRRLVEAPQHQVTIRMPFAVGKYEITVGQYLAFLNSTLAGREPFEPRWIKSSTQDADSPVQQQGDTNKARFSIPPALVKYPMTHVSWDGAMAYTRWLSRRTGKAYRLLSEAEWEYAARAGSSTAYPFGDDALDLCKFANIADQTAQKEDRLTPVTRCDDKYAKVAPVGMFQANTFGLHDMIGNVSEWVEDCWHQDYTRAPADGTAWIENGMCDRRMIRGGSYIMLPSGLRSGMRFANSVFDRQKTLGFRVGRILDGKP